MALKTLEEHNELHRVAYELTEKTNEPHPNGIACPTCGAEMWDSCPTITLASYPPRKNVHCPTCGFIGYRLA